MQRVVNRTLIRNRVALCLAAATPLHAEPLPKHGYVAAGGEIGLAMNGALEGVTVEGGYQITNQPLFARVQLAVGRFGDVYIGSGSHGDDFYQGEGRFARVRLGTEYRPCTREGWLCGLVGADLGVLRTGATEGRQVSSHYTQEQFIPRVGLDVGSPVVRLRATVDLPLGFAQREHDSETSSRSGVQGFSVGAAIAYRF
jgi:hypothetical protein